ncbi:hypothetical protein [Mycobacterium lepromatosis]|nr:hypothetical protein [Mycobacterium lepromatosis]
MADTELSPVGRQCVDTALRRIDELRAVIKSLVLLYDITSR